MDKTPKNSPAPDEIQVSIKKWQQRPASERLDEAARLTPAAYGLKEAPPMDKTLGRIIRCKPGDPDR